MAKSRAVNSAVNIVYSFGVKLVSFLASFFLRTVFIRTLGMEYAGVSGLFTDILTVLSFAELGISTAMTYALYKPIAEKDTDRINRLMNFYKLAYRFVAGTVLAGGLVCVPFLPVIVTDVPNIKESIVLIYLLYVVNTASSYLLIYKSTLLTASQKHYEINKITIKISLTKCVVESILLLVFHNFILYLCVEIFLAIFQNILIGRKAQKEFPDILKGSNHDKLEKQEIKKLFHDIKALFLYKISGVVLSGTDSIIISSFLGTGLVGILANYNLIIKNIYNLVLQIFSSMSASIGNMAVTESSEKQYKVFRALLLLSFWFFGMCAAVLYVCITPFMVLWMGEENTFGTAIVIVLLIDFYLTGMMSPISSFRTSNGLFVQGQYRPLVMAVINIAVSVALVKPLGVLGVLIGTVFSRITTQVWYDPYLIYKYVFNKPVVLYLKKMILYTGITLLCCAGGELLCGRIILGNAFLELVIKAAVSGILFNAVFIALFFRSEEFTYLKDTGFSLVKALKRKKGER